ncbi:ABC transporter permease subunit [Ruficoccus amylovorans]|uniref:ABC transporter permease subunit n=1 Tax=Ruficoccus amylovorans TaxID=1804625 RepID=A0A842HH30_9BACT|nr:ABC transporter permease subunit [Ruficoccus amylovorans]
MRVAANVFPDDAVRAATQKAQSSFATLDPVRLVWLSKALILALLALLAYVVSGLGMLVMCLIGFLLIMSMGMWDLTMLTLAMVVSATLFALILGVPLGVLAARSRSAEKVIRPVLDFMQTLPAFVYLIPAVFFFSLGVVPGAFATLIFAMPPAVRFTTLGIRQVPEEVVEAADAFGANDWQMLVKAQLPIAMPTIMAGLNQTIMLSLSMVVIVGMIGAGGLGEAVLSGIQQMEMGYGFESGLSIVILAIYLDRLTQAMGNKKKS